MELYLSGVTTISSFCVVVVVVSGMRRRFIQAEEDRRAFVDITAPNQVYMINLLAFPRAS